MAAQLAATVYVRDPDTHQTVELAQGTLPEPRLAALVTSRAAWVDGKLPRLPKTQDQGSQDGAQGPTGDGPDGGSGAASDQAAADPNPDDQAAPAAKKTAAKKTAATSRSRGRTAAEQSSGE